MGCVDSGKLRAYCDGELTHSEVAKLESHIAKCARCKAQLDDVRQTGLLVSTRLSALAPLEKESPSSVNASLASLRRKLASREERRPAAGWLGGLIAGLNYQWRGMVAGLVAVAVIASLVALPPVRSMAGELLGIFRVQKFTPVTVDPGTLTSIPMLDPRMMGTLEGISQMPTIQSGLSSTEAAAKVGFPVRLPTQLPPGVAPEPRLGVIDAFSFAYTFDLAKAQAYLDSLGIKGINLPKTPDGKKISATVPAHLIAEYRAGEDGATALVLIEETSPSMEIPAGVDPEEVRNAILSYPGLPPELVAQLRALDWKTTAPVPVIKGDTSRQVAVDGVEGLLIQSSTQKASVLLWQKEDIVYVLAGPVSNAELIAAANSMR